MAWAGGTFTRANPTWATDASLGIGIEAGRHDAQDNDFTTGINQCLNKDGSNSATGNLNFGGYLPTNVAAGTAAAPAYCPGNDVNTGMYGPAADTLAFATNGSERVRINSTGSVGIGISPLTINPASRLEIAGDSSASTVTMSRFSADTSPQVCILTKSRSGTVGTNTVVQNGDGIGAIVFQGANGTSYNNAASIECIVDGAPGLSDMPGRLVFYTSPDGSGTVVERMRINSAGQTICAANSSGGFAMSVSNAGATNAYGLIVDGAKSDYALAVRDNTSTYRHIFNANGTLGIGIVGATATINVDTNSRVGIGTAAPGFQLHLSTDSAAKPTTNTWTISSDERIKTNIQPYTKGLTEICQVNPITYDYNGKGGIPAGPGGVSIIAQDLQPVFPECIGTYRVKLEETDEEETDILNYNGHAITFALINAIKELNAKVEALEAKVADLEAVTEL